MQESGGRVEALNRLRLCARQFIIVRDTLAFLLRSEEGKHDGLVLIKCHLMGADLRGAYLQKAQLWGTDFRGASLICWADLTDSNLLSADFLGAELGNDFSIASLDDANLGWTTVVYSNFSGTRW